MLITRAITPADLDIICHHRVSMFREMGRADDVLSAQAEPFRRWLEPRLIDGTYFGYVTEEAGKVIGGVGLVVVEWPPGPSHPNDHRRGYIMNVYVEPTHRGRGVAKGLVHESELAFRRLGIAYVYLHASEAGRPLYEAMGWAPTNIEMSRILRSEDAA